MDEQPLLVEGLISSSFSYQVASSPETLQYEPLGPNQIRIAQLLPGRDNEIVEMILLPPVTLGNLPPYQALSYVWGDPTITNSIRINNVEVEVTENLAAFSFAIDGVLTKRRVVVDRCNLY
jgi:hypothetical protein